MRQLLSVISVSFILIYSNYTFSQPEQYIYRLLNSDWLFIDLISENVVGNEIEKTYVDLYNQDTFKIVLRNDSTFFNLDGNQFFLGTSLATMGDIWHPLRILPYTYGDTNYTQNCQSIMNLEVIKTDSCLVSNIWLKRFYLKDLDHSFGFPYDHVYVEKIGPTITGPLYNYWDNCSWIIDYTRPDFISYQSQDIDYVQLNVCPDFVGIEEKSLEPKIILDGQYVEFIADNETVKSIKVYNAIGVKVSEALSSRIEKSTFEGLLFFHVLMKNGSSFSYSLYF